MKKINRVKKFLNIKKQDLILQQVFKQHGKEFENTEDAVEYILKLMEEKENGINSSVR